jgi:sortase A
MLRTLVFSTCFVLVGLVTLPIFPHAEVASTRLDTSDSYNAPSPLGENLGANRELAASRPRDVAKRDALPRKGELTLAVPRLGLEGVPVPTGSTQEELDEEGILRLAGSGMPWQEGSNTFIAGHRLGFARTRVPYVFYELDEMKPGDEIFLTDAAGREYVFQVYDRLTVRPADYWVTYPEDGKTIVSLQTCTPIPSFEKRLVVRGELVGASPTQSRGRL